MNKSVLRTTIAVIICMLAFEYILKLFLPKEFVLVISNPNLIKAGNFINNNFILNFIVSNIMSITTYYLFTCAISHKKILNKKLTIAIILLSIIGNAMNYINYNFVTPFLVCSMIFIGFLSNSEMKDFSIVFIVHTIAQVLSLEIRNLTTYMVSFDILTCFCLGFDAYLWLLLFYVLNCFNIKEKESGVKSNGV